MVSMVVIYIEVFIWAVMYDHEHEQLRFLAVSPINDWARQNTTRNEPWSENY